jgi:hypothetical protein
MTAQSQRPRSRPLTGWDRRCLREAMLGFLRENPPPRPPDPPPSDEMPPASRLYRPTSRDQLADPFSSGD